MKEKDVTELASRIQLLIMDVDGVMTDGRFLFVPMPDGSVVEAKEFDSADGAAIGLARRSNIKLGILSGRTSAAVARRAEEQCFDFCYQGLGWDKLEAFLEIAARSAFSYELICYIGDDLPDVPILRRVGFPVAVANACVEAKDSAAYITRKHGGQGAIREVVELILRAQGKWDKAIAEFMK
jgi:3-deoxy-D-manno-octulosonate 8-phosphate phosphatase (KDO 8-P phosphatase)